MLKRDNNKHGTSRLIRVLGVAAATAVVASLAVAGTVAAQTSRLFDDVPRGHYAYDAIEWAVENGITEGCGDGTNFCPTKTLNRAQMITFLKRYHDKLGTDASSSSSGSNDDSEVETTIRGNGSDFTRSVRLTSGWWEVEFDVDDDRRLGQVTLEAVDEDDVMVEIVNEDVSDEYFNDSFRIRIGGGSGTLGPGRVWFDVDTRGGATWTITVSEL